MKRNLSVAFVAVLFLIQILSSCNKIDSTNIGSDLIPAVDNVHTFDTVIDAIITHNSLLDDSTLVPPADFHALGYISNDPVFGKTSGAVYALFQPSSYGNIPFADSVIALDSVVLALNTPYVYGDTNSTVRINIYEIDQSERTKFKDSFNSYTAEYGYRTDAPYFATAGLLGTQDQLLSKVNDADSILEGAVKTGISNQIRIRLDNSFGDRFLAYDTSVYKTDSAFRDHFMGLALMPDTNYAGSNGLAYIYLKDSSTRLSFYYHARMNGKDTALMTAFSVSSNTAANIIRRNRTGTPLESALSDTAADNQLYIQGSPGTFARIDIPGLENISNRVIQRAELIVPRIPSPSDDVMDPPQVLFLDAIDTAHHLFRTIQNDFQSVTGASTLQYNLSDFGGRLKNDQYVFNLTRYLQGIVTRHEINFPLRIYAPFATRTTYVGPGLQSQVDVVASKAGQDLAAFAFYVQPYVAGGRVVLGGGNYPNASQRIRLRIIYTR